MSCLAATADPLSACGLDTDAAAAAAFFLICHPAEKKAFCNMFCNYQRLQVCTGSNVCGFVLSVDTDRKKQQHNNVTVTVQNYNSMRRGHMGPTK